MRYQAALRSDRAAQGWAAFIAALPAGGNEMNPPEGGLLPPDFPLDMGFIARNWVATNVRRFQPRPSPETKRADLKPAPSQILNLI